MSPRPTPVTTRLDARYPLLWRDERTVQFGLEGVVAIDVDEPWVEPLLLRLQAGIRPASFDVVAHGVGAPRVAARELLSRLRPVLVSDPAPAPPVSIEGVNLSDDRALERMRQAIEDEGIAVADPDAPDAVALVLLEGAAAALQLAPYLREDRAHLPVAFEREAAVIGPLVVPGRTPCLSCRDEHETRRDPAWPMLHAQLVGRSVSISAARIALAARLAARVLRTPVEEAGLTVRVSPDGRLAWRSVRHHEECPCLETPSRSPRGTATAPAPLVPRCETTRSRGYARPA